jgi:hypothetical protein
VTELVCLKRFEADHNHKNTVSVLERAIETIEGMTHELTRSHADKHDTESP